ncbi:hypothetical protein JNUCC42_10415 [Brevibacterium sp. JNUCC-42]|nr:hypothetical protein JNUCC42_10415 [Brevibacterium sp. JNUCC-42]
MNKKSKGLIFTAVAAALFTTAMIPQVQAAATNVSNVLYGVPERAERVDIVSEMAVLKLTEQQRKSLQDRGLPVKQTPKEAETTGLELVSLVKPVDNGDGTGYQPPHTGEVDIVDKFKITVDEFQKKYGDADYVWFGAWE